MTDLQKYFELKKASGDVRKADVSLYKRKRNQNGMKAVTEVMAERFGVIEVSANSDKRPLPLRGLNHV